MKSEPLVSIIMGSQSDLETLQQAADVLRYFGVPYEMRIISAHRTPDAARRFALSAEERGVKRGSRPGAVPGNHTGRLTVRPLRRWTRTYAEA